jgi:HAD superfamily hydrolase (TIGR01509 family)
MQKAIIFDMDGLMVDTELQHSQTFEAILREYGVEPTKDQHGVVHTPGVKGLENWKNFKQKYGIDEDELVLLEKKKAKMLELHQKLGIEALPGLIPLIKRLHKHGFKMAVGTSSVKDRALLVIEKLGIPHYLPVVVTGEDVTHGKPAPDIYLKAALQLEVEPANCLVFEDAEQGVLAAKAAGMKCIAVPNKYTHLGDFSKADLVLDSLEEATAEVIDKLLS